MGTVTRHDGALVARRRVSPFLTLALVRGAIRPHPPNVLPLAVDEATQVAPEEIRPALVRIAPGIDAVFQLYEDADFDFSRLDPDAATAYLLEHGNVVEAATFEIDTSIRENC